MSIITGESDEGVVHGSGTHDLGFGRTRTFSFDATRNAAGAVGGTFSVSESQGFSLTGTDRLPRHPRRDRAADRPRPRPERRGFGSMYATIFIEDGGAGGDGDLISFNAYRNQEPFGCLALMEIAVGTPFIPAISTSRQVRRRRRARRRPGPTTPDPRRPEPTPSPTPPPTAATTEHPVIASGTSPGGGTVTVTESTTNDPPPVGSGYTFLGHQLDIDAPAADTVNPITLVFNVDAALLASVDPDLTASTVTVFRNGVPVLDCTADPDDDPATPDPCVSARATLTGGDDEGDARSPS